MDEMTLGNHLVLREIYPKMRKTSFHVLFPMRFQVPLNSMVFNLVIATSNGVVTSWLDVKGYLVKWQWRKPVTLVSASFCGWLFHSMEMGNGDTSRFYYHSIQEVSLSAALLIKASLI